MKDSGIEKLLALKIVPQALFKTLSHPSRPPGQDNEPIQPHLFKVIEPVSITPTVARTAIAILAHLKPWS